jgi:hypothetical protein
MTEHKRITILRRRESLRAAIRQHLPFTVLLAVESKLFTETDAVSNDQSPLDSPMKNIRGSWPSRWAYRHSASSSAWDGGILAGIRLRRGDRRRSFVSSDEFKRAYENTYRFYKEKVPGDFKDETIKQYVVEQLIDNRVWLIAAHNMGLTISDEDLRESIIQIPEFQKNGRFDPEHYPRVAGRQPSDPFHVRSRTGQRTADAQGTDDGE